jgi:HAD superfamily hydrolase (TIGR01662 family)
VSYKAVIFDLDQTLVDSAILSQVRAQRDWATVYQRLSDIKVYDGIAELLEVLQANKIPMVIVTSSPRPYCSKVVNFFNFPISSFVCFHDTTARKPHPEPMNKAVEVLCVKREEVIAVGDEVKDIESANAAGIFNIGCTWGGCDELVLVSAKPHLLCKSVSNLRQELTSKLTIR